MNRKMWQKYNFKRNMFAAANDILQHEIPTKLTYSHQQYRIASIKSSKIRWISMCFTILISLRYSIHAKCIADNCHDFLSLLNTTLIYANELNFYVSPFNSQSHSWRVLIWALDWRSIIKFQLNSFEWKKFIVKNSEQRIPI